MTTPPLGFGLAPIGSSPLGTGVPANAGTGSPRVFRRPDGSQGDAALIDLATRDFVLDATGQKVGWSSLEQRVYLAVVTDLGSAADTTLGMLRPGGTITPDLAQRNEQAARAALKRMTDSGEIEVVSVTTSRLGPSSIRIDVKWRETTTGAVRSTFV